MTEAIEKMFSPSAVDESTCLVFYVINQLSRCEPCALSILKMGVTNFVCQLGDITVAVKPLKLTKKNPKKLNNKYQSC